MQEHEDPEDKTVMSEPEYTSRVPDFELPLVRGGTATLRDSLAGKQGGVVVFWSGVCSHCTRYDEYLNEFETRHAGFSLLVVASREQESRDQLLAALSSRKLQFPLLQDADRSLAHRWFVRQTPTAFLVDPNLQVIYRGAIDNFKYPQDEDYAPYLDAAVEALSEGRTPARPQTATFGCPIESVYFRMPKPLGP